MGLHWMMCSCHPGQKEIPKDLLTYTDRSVRKGMKAVHWMLETVDASALSLSALRAVQMKGLPEEPPPYCPLPEGHTWGRLSSGPATHSACTAINPGG